MSNLPAGFHEGELYCFPIGPAQDSRFAVIPGPPTVELNSDRLAIELIDAPDGAVFSLESVWQVEPQMLERVRTAIAARYPEASEITLDVADLRDVQASLAIADLDGHVQAFGPRPVSGSATNRAVFNESLAGAASAAVARALAGDAGILILRYTGTLNLQETVMVEIQGDLADSIKALSPKQQDQRRGFFHKKMPPAAPLMPTLDECARAIDQAIRQGQLCIINMSTANISQQACDNAVATLRSQLAGLLADRCMQLGENAAHLSSLPVRLKHVSTEQKHFDIARDADLGIQVLSNGYAA